METKEAQLPVNAQAQPHAVEKRIAQPPAPIVDAPPATRDPYEGISQVDITDAERAILCAEPDPVTEVEIKYDGAVFMPGDIIRQRADRAFGIGKWGVIVEGAPRYDQQSSEIAIEGRLYVKGKYVGWAIGGWTWRPNNPRMSKTDAIESAYTELLRRLWKRVGVGAELWNKAWRDKWIAEYAEEYTNQRTRKKSWRLKSTPQVPPAAAKSAHSEPQPPPAAPVDGPAEAPKCPKCDSEMWNNILDRRKDKVDKAAGRRQKAPRAAAKCKNQDCEFTIWREHDCCLFLAFAKLDPPIDLGRLEGKLQKDFTDWTEKDRDILRKYYGTLVPK